PHVTEVTNRNADFADLAFGKLVIGVVSGLGWKIEGHREARLPLGQVLTVKRVGVRRGRMARVSAENPGFIALSFVSHLSPDGDSLAQRLLQRNIVQPAGTGPASRLPMQPRLRKRDLSPFHESDNE